MATPFIFPNRPINSPPFKPKQPLHFNFTPQKTKPYTQKLLLSHLSLSSPTKTLHQTISFLSENQPKFRPEIYGEILQECVYQRALELGRQIHGHIQKLGDLISKNEFFSTKLLILYAKCDSKEETFKLFEKLAVKNVFSWSAIIGFHCRNGFYDEALLSFSEMQKDGIFPDNFIIPNALKACASLRDEVSGKLIHGYSLKLGFFSCVFVGSSLVDMYGKLGLLEEAEQVFDTMPERNVISWNSIMVGFSHNGENHRVLMAFYEMISQDFEPTRVTIVSLLSACASLEAFKEGKQAHAMAVKIGLQLDNILCGGLIHFYGESGFMDDAQLVFERLVSRDMVAWNLIISGYVKLGHYHLALHCCIDLQKLEGKKPDSVTMVSVISACSGLGQLWLGRATHGYAIRNALESDAFVASGLIALYAKFGKISEAKTVFDSSLHRDVVLWNTIIAEFAELGFSGEALKLFYEMQLSGLVPNVVSWNSMILGFFKNRQVSEAMDMFSQMESANLVPNFITWTTMVSGLAQNGYGHDAIEFFRQMQLKGIKPNSVSIVSVLSACILMALLCHGKEIHGYVIRHDWRSSIIVQTSLIDMYAKCGSISMARKVFDCGAAMELPLYNAMINGYALHGDGVSALSLFNVMEVRDIRPDSITLTSILSACNHAGLYEEGRDIFKNILALYDLMPTMEHYGCIVSLLARSGLIEEALEVLSKMPFEPDAQLYGSLLLACKEHNQIELVEMVSKKLFELEPDNLGNYVSLSNIYASVGKWDEVVRLRKLMRENNWKKNPGCSWIHIGTELHPFMAGDRSHPQTNEIVRVLLSLETVTKFMGFASEINSINQNCLWQGIPCS
ncbi:pentatricopeptide repeat-containing protein At5g55740, chloroplastic [Amborella trichopoda]|uniref:Uncharacterized protein n=1 Tax=Amborella trichopoda TaxID=13333 RepID=W1NN85_AMBTC|nr:pentatricopeptide repeat-containing protein At5g55740, chloroplastic [Amborella trichopoda]ERM97068.1 hypothetical protein AMTR_s00122p00115170 [Amborella trichopoda]|eukprot:XP_006829652.1 pentatricopeptide repeat-containing protein At5g55740, chloroplastic [Amborella trichopoda]